MLNTTEAATLTALHNTEAEAALLKLNKLTEAAILLGETPYDSNNYKQVLADYMDLYWEIAMMITHRYLAK